jgi:osmotically-inducible protein OsmY
MRRLIILTLVVATAAIFAGCETTAPNTNNARANTNNNSNANNIVVVNNNGNANTGAMSTNTNRWSNTNVTKEEYEKNRAEYEKDKAGSTIGTGANDSWLWFKTRSALLTTNDLRESTINVDVVNGVITLKGTVANAAQKASAEKVANGIEGKTSVKNELKVSATDSITNTGTTNSNANMKK